MGADRQSDMIIRILGIARSLRGRSNQQSTRHTDTHVSLSTVESRQFSGVFRRLSAQLRVRCACSSTCSCCSTCSVDLDELFVDVASDVECFLRVTAGHVARVGLGRQLDGSQ